VSGEVMTADTDPDDSADTPTTVRWNRRQPYRWIAEWLLVIFLALAAAIVMRAYVFQTFYIPSGSMEPTLHIGDRILVSKLSVEFGTIHTGDILVFKRPPAETQCGGPPVSDLVKRVIGLPGQRLYSVGNTIYVNGKVLDQDWTHNEPLGVEPVGNGKNDPVVVPPNSYFMMGDNEAYSCDSRYWGPIPRSLVVGKVIMRIWPPSRVGFL
jgi:signal peptidase I